MTDQPAPAMRPGIPEYDVEWHAELELWAVLESGFPLCYCPEEASARFIAQACRATRRRISAVAQAHAQAAQEPPFCLN